MNGIGPGMDVPITVKYQPTGSLSIWGTPNQFDGLIKLINTASASDQLIAAGAAGATGPAGWATSAEAAGSAKGGRRR